METPRGQDNHISGPAPAGSLRTYKDVKQFILACIRSGKWPPHHRVPSENELVVSYGVSKTTAERALYELAGEGVLLRIPGTGSFVAKPKGFLAVFDRLDIADDIRQRGKIHTANVITLSENPASFEIGNELGVEVGSTVFHSVILHHKDNVPVQLEDRFVLPSAVPAYLAQDFTERTPTSYLLEAAQGARNEYSIRAVSPEGWEQTLLAILPTKPCLSIHVRLTSNRNVVSVARLVSPAGRYRLEAIR
ncbi:Histidine utilization repressor (plasmid) [Rhizobium leguminosarum]|uniref:Histidine utilization repressor n=1 Tax=Rhizobium leguminosarum TaxID=384 RepID=A0A2K9ZD11_RHILE|nr:UTRA domain-containing protein [Rhizobium leguminosarum]AUW46135.1 Histidine utilization repressor [Rhizobium leguminosarum]